MIFLASPWLFALCERSRALGPRNKERSLIAGQEPGCHRKMEGKNSLPNGFSLFQARLAYPVDLKSMECRSVVEPFSYALLDFLNFRRKEFD